MFQGLTHITTDPACKRLQGDAPFSRAITVLHKVAESGLCSKR